jgi:hypothetical protein
MHRAEVMPRMMREITIASLAGLIACAHAPPRGQVADDRHELRLTNLERAARYPWLDEGACAVREASNEWKVLAERCYHALDLSRIRFQDPERRCAVASVDAATIGPIVGACLLAQPELVVAAVIIVGTVIVAAAIVAELQRVKSGCDCICLGSGATDGKGQPVNDGPYWPPPGWKIATAAQCDYACTSAGYAKGICKK